MIDIDKLDEVSILKPEVFAELLDLESEVEKVELEELLVDMAHKLGVKERFVKRLVAYKADNKKINKCVTEHSIPLTNDVFGWEYIQKSKYGYTVNSSVLADYIRNNSHYIIINKKGSNKDFIYWYEDGYYKLISTNELKGKIKEYIPISIRKPKHWEDAYKELITDSCNIGIEELNKDIELINFKNGIYNTKTGKLEKHDPKYLHTRQLNACYNPDAKEPKTWLNFINTLANGNQGIINTLQEWFGFTISNYEGHRLKKMMALYGTVGNTGKTRYTNMLTYIIGQENICSKMIQDLYEKFGTGALYGTKCMIIDDQTAAPLEDSSIIKAITGSGYITMQLKGIDDFLYYYTGNITFNCNALFYIKGDKGNHMYERFIIIPCDNVIPEDKRDKNLDEKLRKEVDGIVLWALKGLDRLIKNNFNITISPESEAALEEYRSNNDTVFRFIKEAGQYRISGDSKDSVKQKEFNDAYIEWCKNCGYEAVKNKNIEASMKGKGIKCCTIHGYKYYKGLSEELPF